MTQGRRRASPAGAVALLVAAVAAGCGGGGERPAPSPADEVRASVTTYLRALEERRWERACDLMTGAARRELADAAGAPCPRALAAGAALAPEELATASREVAGADVRVDGAAATLGPIGGLPAPLRLQRAGARWLIAG